MTNVVRAAFLAVIILLIILGSLTGYLEEAVDRWREFRLSVRLILTMAFGWPFIAFVSPVLVDFWSFITEWIVGFGGEYMISDLRVQLLLILIAIIVAQTTILMMKLKRIEEQL